MIAREQQRAWMAARRASGAAPPKAARYTVGKDHKLHRSDDDDDDDDGTATNAHEDAKGATTDADIANAIRATDGDLFWRRLLAAPPRALRRLQSYSFDVAFALGECTEALLDWGKKRDAISWAEEQLARHNNANSNSGSIDSDYDSDNESNCA